MENDMQNKKNVQLKNNLNIYFFFLMLKKQAIASHYDSQPNLWCTYFDIYCAYNKNFSFINYQ